MQNDLRKNLTCIAFTRSHDMRDTKDAVLRFIIDSIPQSLSRDFKLHCALCYAMPSPRPLKTPTYAPDDFVQTIKPSMPHRIYNAPRASFPSIPLNSCNTSTVSQGSRSAPKTKRAEPLPRSNILQSSRCPRRCIFYPSIASSSKNPPIFSHSRSLSLSLHFISHPTAPPAAPSPQASVSPPPQPTSPASLSSYAPSLSSS